MSKYHSKKITTPDGTFDSKKELRRWEQLKLMEKEGTISDLKRQVEYVLIPNQYIEKIEYTPKKQKVKLVRRLAERKLAYVADFTYKFMDDLVVEDTKGFRTKDYIIKRKLMLWVHGIRITEV